MQLYWVTPLKMDKLPKNPPFFILEWFLFLILAVTSGFFMKEVLMNYFSKATSFKIYDEEVKELPTFTFCPDPVLNKLEYGKDFLIKYGKNNNTLMEGLNNVQFNDFKEIVHLEKITTYNFGACYMISTNKYHQQLTEEGGYEIFYFSYAEQIVEEEFPTMKVFIASKKNSYGTTNSYWVEGEVMKFELDKNTNEIGVQLKMAKEIYLINKGLCHEESFQECLARELFKQDYSSCPKKCVVFSLPTKALPICQTNEEVTCSMQFIQPIFQEIATKRTCKKSCTTFDISGTVNVKRKNDSQVYYDKTFYYTIEPPYLVKVSEEYIIYDVIGMVASIGGTLGLFIGFSFTNVTSGLINLMKKLLKNKRQCDEEKVMDFTKDMLLQFKENQNELKIVQRQIRNIQEKMVQLT